LFHRSASDPLRMVAAAYVARFKGQPRTRINLDRHANYVFAAYMSAGT
jgi:hypothetical protein